MIFTRWEGYPFLISLCIYFVCLLIQALDKDILWICFEKTFKFWVFVSPSYVQ